MRTVTTKEALREALREARRAERSIGLVPTMGALHEGHLSLVRAARGRCDLVVVTLFVNPAQFGPGEDLDAYPRDPDRDAELASEQGADLMFAPSVEEMYGDGLATAVEVTELTEVLCGAPGRRGQDHFRAVTTVVAKLLNIAQPDIAFFGQKDAQQAILIRRMVEDLDFPVRINVEPTVREPDGLAMSSRNRYLSAGERERAAALSAALDAARAVVAGGESSVDAMLDAARAHLAEAGIDPEYLEARDAEDLTPVESLNGRPILVAVAAQVGRARLIDNVLIRT